MLPNPKRIRCHSSEVEKAKEVYPNAEVVADDSVENGCWLADEEDQ